MIDACRSEKAVVGGLEELAGGLIIGMPFECKQGRRTEHPFCRALSVVPMMAALPASDAARHEIVAGGTPPEQPGRSFLINIVLFPNNDPSTKYAQSLHFRYDIIHSFVKNRRSPGMRSFRPVLLRNPFLSFNYTALCGEWQEKVAPAGKNFPKRSAVFPCGLPIIKKF